MNISRTNNVISCPCLAFQLHNIVSWSSFFFVPGLHPQHQPGAARQATHSTKETIHCRNKTNNGYYCVHGACNENQAAAAAQEEFKLCIKNALAIELNMASTFILKTSFLNYLCKYFKLQLNELYDIFKSLKLFLLSTAHNGGNFGEYFLPNPGIIPVPG